MKKLLLVTCVCLLLGCSNISDDTSITIGGIAPLSGNGKDYGDLFQRVANLRVEQLNKTGGINGRDLKIIWEDGKCDYKEAQKVAKKLIKKNQVKVILGGACSDETLGAALITDPNEVILMSPLSTSPDVSNAGEYVFRTSRSSESQGRLLAQYANSNHLKKVALLIESNRYTDPISVIFRDRFSGQLIEEFVGGDRYNSSEIVTKIKNSSPDGIFLNFYSVEIIKEVLEEIKRQEFKTVLLGNSLAINVFREIATNDNFWKSYNVIGCDIIIDESQIQFQEFMKLYEDRYGEVTRYVDFVATTLDAVDVLANTLYYVDDIQNTSAIRQILLQDQRAGFSGRISFDKNGDIDIENILIRFNGETFVPIDE